MVKISVITINYNNKDGLVQTLHSVISQTYPHIEYIIIDGGSDDGSVSEIEKYTHRIHYWKSERDNGIYHAMNKGIQHASGEYLLFMNSGDYFSSTSVIEEIIPSLKKDIVYGAADWRVGESSEIHIYPEYLTLDYFYRASLPHQSTFIKKSVFEKAGYYTEDFKIASDWELWVKAIFMYDCSYMRIPHVVSVFDATGISNHIKGKEILKIEKELVFKRYFPGIHEDYIYAHNIRAFFYSNWVLKLLRKLKIIRLEHVFRNAKNGY